MKISASSYLPFLILFQPTLSLFIPLSNQYHKDLLNELQTCCVRILRILTLLLRFYLVYFVNVLQKRIRMDIMIGHCANWFWLGHQLETIRHIFLPDSMFDIAVLKKPSRILVLFRLLVVLFRYGFDLIVWLANCFFKNLILFLN